MSRDLASILHLDVMEDNLFEGRSPTVGWRRVFGGLVLGQALTAVNRSVEGLLAHSLHAYFILPGDPSIPIRYAVEKLRDGRSFATRRVVAHQDGAAIFALSASFHRPEPGFEHQLPMPAVKPPEQLLSEKDIVANFGPMLPPSILAYLKRERPIEIRMVDLRRFMGQRQPTTPDAQPTQHVWFKATRAVTDDPAHRRAALAYVSDMTLLDTSMVAHGKSVFDRDMQVASLDHAMWFHAEPDFSDWLLYAQDSPAASGARGLTRGLIYNRDGRLVASVAQEGLIRHRPDLAK
jgi:acyl-CoA thioesterase-2